MMKTVSLQVFGRVQGVWFRASTQIKARELGIKGFVKNQADGSVYIEAEGEQPALNSFIEWCHIGPKHASVTNVVTEQIEPKHFLDFDIKRWS